MNRIMRNINSKADYASDIFTAVCLSLNADGTQKECEV